MNADEILQGAVGRAVATYQFGLVIHTRINVNAVALSLEYAAVEAADLLPETPQHLGAVWEFR